jgi:choline-sulfatase
MRIIYIDIDSLRPDHLGCYGYHRDTSPNIDDVASEGTRFTNCYVSDAPCLPSRTALWSGRFGYQTGVVDHGGTAAQPINEGPGRGFRDSFADTSWMGCLRSAGYKTATISTFGERHSAWHWYAGFNEVYNVGGRGYERADQVTPIALDWLQRNADADNWFLHVNLWDPHTPYQTPPDFENPFTNTPLPGFYTQDLWQQSWEGYGPHSPQELNGFSETADHLKDYPDVPTQLESMDRVRWWVDHYDMGIRYADMHVGMILQQLKDMGHYDDTLIIIGADHGENQGELNVWGDHQTADAITCRVPLIVRHPAMKQAGRVDEGLHYHFDWAATLLDLLDIPVPDLWDGQSFADAFRKDTVEGRDYLVTSQGAWSVQRGVRFDQDSTPYLLLRTYHDGYKMLDDLMLFDLAADPHETNNLANKRGDLVQIGVSLLEQWLTEQMRTSPHGIDPLMTVLQSGGGFHTRGKLPAYLAYLEATGRSHHADYLRNKHPDDT